MDEEITLEDLKGEGIEESYIEEARVEKPEKPDFPQLIFLLAVFKDLSDWPGDLISFGLWGTILSFISTPILYLYFRKRPKSVKNKLRALLILTGFGELLPYINLIPFNVILILVIYFKEYKHTSMVLNYLEKADKKTIKKGLKTALKLVT